MALVHHIVIDLVALVLLHIQRLSIVNAEQVITESRNHKELLHHTVHVANAAQVAKTNIFLVALSAYLRWNIVPTLWLLYCLYERCKLLIQECLHQCCAVLNQLVQKLISCLSAFIVRSSCLFLIIARAFLLIDYN